MCTEYEFNLELNFDLPDPFTRRIGRLVSYGLKRGLRGATVARLTPDQKVACSNHVGVNTVLGLIELIDA